MNIDPTVISQYSASPTLRLLLQTMADYYDPTADLDAFFTYVWDVNTAVGYGLDRLGRVVGVGRVLQVSTGTYLGFYPQTDVESFGYGVFFSGTGSTNNFSLTDDAYRLLILAKAASNISDGSIPSINAILMSLFPGRGDCWVIDNLNMTMVYNFNFVLSPVEQAIVAQSGVLPKPCGVTATVAHL